MRNPETNKGTMKMTTKKLIPLLTAMLLMVLPIQGIGVSAAYADSADTSLSTFTIDGEDVEDGDTLIVPLGTTAVTVVATPTDPGANVEITGDTGLETFDNDVVVTVTSSDTNATATYTVNVYVTDKAPGFSTDATLGQLKVNGTVISAGSVVDVAALTNAVTVEVTTTDVNATSVVTGAINLVTGLNTVTIVITAEDGTTTRSYTFKVNVAALSADVALDQFKVNGQNVKNGGRIYLDPATASVSVIATPSDPSASVVVTGSTGLTAGANTLTVTVTAPSGATATYTVTLNVQVPSNISSLVVLKVSGARISNESTVIVPAGTSAVSVTAIPSDVAASVTITGNTDLQIGDNTLTVLVTAEDGSTSTYTATLRVLENDDTSLAVFQYDGSDVADGDVFDLEYGTESVEITAETTTNLSTVEILGADALVVGKNTVRIVVTAQDESVKTYRLFFNVAANTDTTLESVTVAGQDATGGDVTVPFGTRGVSVVPVTTDPFATFTIDGNVDLQTGDNTVTITVTAADGETTEDITITVTVAEQVLSDDTSLESVTVGGQDATGGSVTLPAGTRAAAVIAITTDPFASYTVEGNTDLQPGENTVTISVTAADGETIEDIDITVTVEEVILSDDTSVELFQVNGQDLEDGGELTLPAGSTRVNVKVVTTDPTATYLVEGDGRETPLAEGSSELVVTVTAANGDTATYTIALTVLAISENADLAEEDAVTVNGEVVDAEKINNPTGYVSVPLTTTSVSISANAADVMADVFVAGKTVLPGKSRLFSVERGVNDIEIKVIPQAGEEFVKTYTLKIYVGGADGSLKTVKVNNTAVTFDGDTATLTPKLANGTATATIFVDPTVALGTESTPGTKIEIDGAEPGANANTFVVSGLETGDNSFSIVITPGDTTAEQVTWNLVIPVLESSDKRLKTFLVDGIARVPGSTIVLPKGTTSAELDGETESEVATYEVEGGDELLVGVNTLKITVTAEDQSTQVYTVTALVPSTVDVIVVGFPKAGVLTVDAKSNAAGNKVLVTEIKKIAKKKVILVQVTNNFLLPKEKAAAGVTRAQNITKLLQGAKFVVPGPGITTKYEITTTPKNTKGATVTIYYF